MNHAADEQIRHVPLHPRRLAESETAAEVLSSQTHPVEPDENAVTENDARLFYHSHRSVQDAKQGEGRRPFKLHLERPIDERRHKIRPKGNNVQTSRMCYGFSHALDHEAGCNLEKKNPDL